MDNANRDIVRNRIVEAASDMLMKHSCRQITMDTIAKEIGVSKRTIYELFSDKETLLEKCVVNIIEKDDSIELFKNDVHDNFLVTLSRFSDLHSSETFRLRCATTMDISKFVYLRGMATPKAIEEYNEYVAKNNRENKII